MTDNGINFNVVNANANLASIRRFQSRQTSVAYVADMCGM